MKIYLDIETVRGLQIPTLSDLESMGFIRKFTRDFENEDATEQDWINLYRERASLYAEFGKIMCVSFGVVTPDNKIKLKTVASENETELLHEVAQILKSASQVIAHNGIEFDFPWLIRRMIVNKVRLPEVLNTYGKKPWETNLVDTAQIWKFGQYKNYTSLATLCHLFGIPSP
jgi:DNA polymerase elongation subunit (family B)